MKAPTRIGNGWRNIVKISSAHQFIFKILAHLFILNFVIIPAHYTRNAPQLNVIQTVPHVQYFVTNLNDVTQKGLNYTQIVKMRTILNIR